jgi:SAM-dependent methyltransferase
MADYQQYFAHLKSISWLGRLYKRYFASQVLFSQAKYFGKKIAEIGSGVGSGILGAYPHQVTGFEINPLAVNFCKHNNLDVHLVEDGKKYPAQDGEFDVCILDNVLEHITEPTFILQECSRITRKAGGLIIAVPGDKGFLQDSDHKKHYDEQELKSLSPDWQLTKIFSLPFMVKSCLLSRLIPQYCLVAVYKKR